MKAGDGSELGVNAIPDRPESTTVAGSSMIENQPSNVESKTTVGTAAAAAQAKRNQQVPARMRVYQP